MITTEYLMSLPRDKRKEVIQKERIKCAIDYKYLIETYFTVDSAGSTVKFKLYPHQITALQSYIDYSNNISMKSRQMGFTTFTSAFAAAEMINNSGYKIVIISKEQNSAIEFVRKIKEILDNARNMTRISKNPGSVSWLIPEYEDGYNNKKAFRLINGSFAEGQGNSDDSGRGVSGLNLLIIDESFNKETVINIKDKNNLIEKTTVESLYLKLPNNKKTSTEQFYIDDKKDEFINKLSGNKTGVILDYDNLSSQDEMEIVHNTKGIKILTPNEEYVEFEAIKKIITNSQFTLKLENGTELKASKYHKVKLSNDEFIYLKDISIGNEIKTKNGISKCIGISEEEGKFEMYDILGVGKRSEFYSNGIISHNCAFIDRKVPGRMDEIWSAAGPALSTTGGKAIMISTPYGTQGWYYDTYINADNMGFNIIEAHWSIHPIFNQGMYKWIKDPNKRAGGYIKFYNKEWPEEMDDPKTKKKIEIPKTKYEFICDGKLRSPWYDFMSRRLGPKKTARELDCSFVGTGGEVLPQDLIREMDINAKSVKYKKKYKRGPLSKYKEFEAPIEGETYMITSDVMTGDGTDFSTAVVLRLRNEYPPKVVGTIKIQIQPKYLAIIIRELAKRYNNALIVVENQGSGSTTLNELKEQNIPNIYYSVLKKKDEFGAGQKRKIGLWQTEDTRNKGGDELEVIMLEKEMEVPCVDIVHEFYTWIWDKNGRRDHAPGKHDDLIMALQNGIYVWKYYLKKKIRRSVNAQNSLLVDTNGMDYSELLDPLYEEKEMFQKQKQMIDKTNSKVKSESRYVPKIFFG